MADLKVPSQSVAGVHEQFHRAPVNLYTFVFGGVVKTMSPSAVQFGYIRKYMDVSKKKKSGYARITVGNWEVSNGLSDSRNMNQEYLQRKYCTLHNIILW